MSTFDWLLFGINVLAILIAIPVIAYGVDTIFFLPKRLERKYGLRD